MIKGEVRNLIKTIEKKRVVRYIFLGVICLVLISILVVFNRGPTGYAVYEDSTQGDFDNGTYINVSYNGGAVVLVGTNLSGSYASQVFDADGNSVWNNISWNENEPAFESFFCVDGGGEVYQSVNEGINWSLKKENYGRTTDTQYMFSDSDYIYIISNSNREVWRSNDLGVNWNVVNDSFADSGLLVGKKDSNDNLFVVDASGDVYLSSNNGVDWVLLSDFNAGATNNAKGIRINSSDDIYIVDGAGDVYSSIDSGVSWTKVNDGYGGSTGTDDMEVDDNDYLYILLNSDVYQSTDDGVSWDKVNDDFSPYSNDGQRMFSSGANLYIADGVGRVFKSADSGASWIEIGDCNSATNNPKGLTGFIQNTDLSFQVRSCDDIACSGESWIEINDTSPQDLSIDNNRYFQYKVSFSSLDSSITPELYNVSIDYDLLNTAPVMGVVVPSEGASYGYNESLELNFSAFDNEDNIDSCWYNIDNGANVSIASCANTTFNVSGDGNYVINVYVNDTNGEEVNDSASFNIQIGAPSIVLHFPINEYLNYQENINFNYTPTDVDLDSCELWGDFDGSFSLNQTETSPNKGVINTFILNLSDSEYLWNIRCNDSIGNSAFNGNQTFYIDTINPEISVSEPIGIKTSRTVSSAWVVSDVNLDSCWYNVYQGASLEVVNTSVNCLDNTASFSVSTDADFTFNFYVKDSAGNQNYTNSSFSVDTSSSPSPSTGGGGSGGGGGGYYPSEITGKMQVTQIGELIAYEGDEKSLSLNVKNVGSKFLNNCRLIAKGDISSWVYLDQIEGIAPGENIDFNFNLNIPEEIGLGDYSGELEINCDEGTNTQTVIIIIPGLEIIEIIDIVQEKNKLTINYILKDDSFIGKEIELDIWVVDSEGVEIKRIINKFLGESGEKEIVMQLTLDSAGVYSIYFALSSNLENFIRKSVILGKSQTLGMVVLESVKSKMTVYVIFLLVLGVGVFFIWRRHKENSPHIKKNKNKWLLKKKGAFR